MSFALPARGGASVACERLQAGTSPAC
jgi:hypothetical protein